MFFKKTCIWGECLAKKAPGCHYCLNHKCNWVGCTAEINTLNNRFCNKHICLKCNTRIKDETVQFCTEHRCKWRDCINIIKDDEDFCVEHEIEKEMKDAKLQKMILENKELKQKYERKNGKKNKKKEESVDEEDEDDEEGEKEVLETQ